MLRWEVFEELRERYQYRPGREVQIVDHKYTVTIEVDQLVHEGGDRLVTEVPVDIEEFQCLDAECRVERAERSHQGGPELHRVGVGDIAREPRHGPSRARL